MTCALTLDQTRENLARVVLAWLDGEVNGYQLISAAGMYLDKGGVL